MKLNLLIILFLACTKVAIAQDSIKIETVQDSFITPQYSTVYDDVFMNNKETKWLLKFDGLGLLNLRSINIPTSYLFLSSYFYKRNVQLEFEHKLNKNISLNYLFATIFNVNFRGFLKEELYNEYRLGIEPRWYFRGNESKMANNLNGSYVGLNLLYARNRLSEGIWDRFTKLGIVANYGIQKRVFNHFYINYQLGIGVGKGDIFNNFNESNTDLSYWLNRKFTIGLALGDSKKGQFNTCDLFRCFEEEKSLWKLDLRSIYKTAIYGVTSLTINPEFETKIKNSSFSVNTGLALSFEKNSFAKVYNLKTSVEPRYYYNMKKRIALGKSANNLSGNYFSIDISGSYFNMNNYLGGLTKFRDSTVKAVSRRDYTCTIEPRWGIQRRLFKNGFIDFSLALIRLQKTYITNYLKTEDGATKTTLKIEQFSVEYNKLEKRNVPTKTPVPSLYLKLGLAF